MTTPGGLFGRSPRLTRAGWFLAGFALAVGGVLHVGAQDVETQFKVTAETEFLQFSTDTLRRFKLYADGATVSADNGEWAGVTGIVEPAERVTVMVSRIASGPVTVTLQPHPDATAPTAVLRDSGVALRGEVFVIYPPPTDTAPGREKLSFHFVGRGTRIGQLSSATSGAASELLRTGTVELLGRSFAGDEFQAGDYELGPGDMVACGANGGCGGADTALWTGVVVADERPALSGVFMARATEIRLHRGAESHPMRVSFFRRLVGDPGLALLWVTLAFLAQVAAGLLVNDLQRRVDIRRGEPGKP